MEEKRQHKLKYIVSEEELEQKSKDFSSHLQKIAQRENIILKREELLAYSIYYKMLVAENAKINLTTIISPHAAAEKHMLDSLLFFKIAQIPPHATVIDIGTGAGFPGLVLKIHQKDIRLTLLDSLQKRVLFLEKVAQTLNLKNIDFIHARAEDLGKTKEHHRKYDYIFHRAVARLDKTLCYSIPFMKKSGIICAYKGPKYLAEIEAAEKILQKFKLHVKVDKFTLGESKEERAIIRVTF